MQRHTSIKPHRPLPRTREQLPQPTSSNGLADKKKRLKNIVLPRSLRQDTKRNSSSRSKRAHTPQLMKLAYFHEKSSIYCFMSTSTQHEGRNAKPLKAPETQLTNLQLRSRALSFFLELIGPAKNEEGDAGVNRVEPFNCNPVIFRQGYLQA